jgi:hypothetical protein
MHTPTSPRCCGSAIEIWTVYRGQRLLGHVLGQSSLYEAHSWPGEILIGIYRNRIQAAAAIVATDGSNASADDENVRRAAVSTLPHCIPRFTW